MTGLIAILGNGPSGQSLPSPRTKRTPASKGNFAQFSYCLLFCLALILSCADAAACTGSSTYNESGGPFSTSQTYTIGQGGKDITLPTYTSADGCTDTSVTYTLTKNDDSAIPSYATFDANTPKVTITSTNTSLTSQ